PACRPAASAGPLGTGHRSDRGDPPDRGADRRPPPHDPHLADGAGDPRGDPPADRCAGRGRCPALAALIAHRFRGPLLRAIEALGAMALTAYIAQSLVFVALMPAFTLGLGARLGTAG